MQKIRCLFRHMPVHYTIKTEKGFEVPCSLCRTKIWNLTGTVAVLSVKESV